jgi:hypothetical protein
MPRAAGEHFLCRRHVGATTQFSVRLNPIANAHLPSDAMAHRETAPSETRESLLKRKSGAAESRFALADKPAPVSTGHTPFLSEGILQSKATRSSRGPVPSGPGVE